jgi:hypothetical protein
MQSVKDREQAADQKQQQQQQHPFELALAVSFFARAVELV